MQGKKEKLNKIMEEIDREAELSVKKIENCYQETHWELKRILVDFASKYREIWSQETKIANNSQQTKPPISIGESEIVSKNVSSRLGARDKTADTLRGCGEEVYTGGLPKFCGEIMDKKILLCERCSQKDTNSGGKE